MNKKYLSIIILFFLVVSFLSFEVQFVSAQEHYDLSVSIGNPYYLKGETGQITIQSNASTSINLKIYDPQNNLLYNLSRVTNSTGFNILNFPIQQSVSYGDYRVQATAPNNITSSCWFSVPDAENWGSASFPFVKEHKDVSYSIFGNKTFKMEYLGQELGFTLPELPSGVTISCFNTPDIFTARFQSGIIDIDLSFLFIHNGAKLIINGTSDSQKDFRFKFFSPKQIKKWFNKVSTQREGIMGHDPEALMFNWEDLIKAKEHLTWEPETKTLLVHDVPQTFWLDPTFGKTDIGGSNVGLGFGDGTFGCKFTSPADCGTITAITVYYTGAAGTDIIGMVYSDNAGAPDSLLATFSRESTNGTAWITLTGNYVAAPNTVYWLAILGEAVGDWYYDAGAANQTAWNFDVWDVPSDPYGTPTYRNEEISVYATYTPSGANNVPVNNDFSFTDMDDTNNLYSQKQYYTAQYNVTDEDGFADIDYAEWSINQSATVRFTFRFDEDTATWSIQAGSAQWAIDSGSCANVSSGNYLNMTFKFTAKFNATEESNIDINCYVVDDEPENDTDNMQTDYADIVTNLVVSGFACDDDRGDLSQSITFTGTVYYANDPASSTATTFYPPDDEFTAVHVYDSGNVDKGNDATIVNGAFSISFNAPASVGTDTYNPYIDMADAEYTDAEESPTDTFISDQIVAYYEELDDSRVDIDANIEWRIKAVLDYDDTTLGSGDSITSSWGALNWDAGNSWFDISHSESSVSGVTITLSSGSEATYGITSFSENITETTGIYDRINVYWWDANDTRLDWNNSSEIRLRAVLDYDEHALGSGDTVNINGTLADWDAVNSWFQADEDYGSSVEYLYSVSSASEATYGITLVNHNVTRQTINWDRVSVEFSVDDTTPNNNVAVTFTVTLTYESDSDSVGSYTYDINRNNTIFKDDYSSSTFTDTNSTTTLVYDFLHTACVDSSNGILTWVDDSDITVTWSEAEYATKGFVLAVTFAGLLIILPILLVLLYTFTRRRR